MKHQLDKYRNEFERFFYSAALLFVFSTLTLIKLQPLEFIGFFVTTLYVLFLPGFLYVMLFFTKEKLDFIEEFTISFGISIVLITFASLLYILLTPFTYTYVSLLLLTTSVLIILVIVKIIRSNYFVN